VFPQPHECYIGYSLQIERQQNTELYIPSGFYCPTLRLTLMIIRISVYSGNRI